MRMFLMKTTPSALGKQGLPVRSYSPELLTVEAFLPRAVYGPWHIRGPATPAFELLMSNTSPLSGCCLSCMEAGMASG